MYALPGSELSSSRLVRPGPYVDVLFRQGMSSHATCVSLSHAQPIREDMLQMLEQLREVVWTGMVGGSDLPKQQEQIGMDVLDRFDFCFPENGLQAFKMGEKLASQSLVGYLGEKKLQEFINFCLHYIADLDIPIKRWCHSPHVFVMF